MSVSWDEAESLGEGLISVPISFEAEVELDFYVFRSEAFDVPDWVNVSMGDFEEDHYFEASGSRRARFNARLVLGFTDKVMAGQAKLGEAELSVDEVEFEEFV
jgi:hypothetical protein